MSVEASGIRWEDHPVLACDPFRDEVVEAATDTFSVERLIETAKAWPSTFWAEGLIYAWIALNRARPGDLEKIEEAKVGFHRRHPLRELRSIIEASVESLRKPRGAEQLILWGTPCKPHGALNKVMKHLSAMGGVDTERAARAWLKANGRIHHKTDAAARAIIKENMLYMPRSAKFAALDDHAVRLAVELAEAHEKRAVALFKCLSRIAAYQHEALVAWRSSWLQGKCDAGADAIPGVSTPTTRRWLTAVLHQHVLRRVRGHKAGRRCALYEVLPTLSPGIYSPERAEGFIGALVKSTARSSRSTPQSASEMFQITNRGGA
jgi:hypothetical protein